MNSKKDTNFSVLQKWFYTQYTNIKNTISAISTKVSTFLYNTKNKFDTFEKKEEEQKQEIFDQLDQDEAYESERLHGYFREMTNVKKESTLKETVIIWTLTFHLPINNMGLLVYSACLYLIEQAQPGRYTKESYRVLFHIIMGEKKLKFELQERNLCESLLFDDQDLEINFRSLLRLEDACYELEQKYRGNTEEGVENEKDNFFNIFGIEMHVLYSHPIDFKKFDD